jgi:hypothetical protein
VTGADIARAVLDANSYMTLATADASGLPIVVFDSTAEPLAGQAVYLTATAAQVPEPDLERGLAVFSRASVRAGLAEWGLERVTGDARLRLYRATATEHYILDPDASIDTRIPVVP